jgi:hypothetical protein
LIVKSGVTARDYEKPAFHHVNAAKPELSDQCMIPQDIICLAQENFCIFLKSIQKSAGVPGIQYFKVLDGASARLVRKRNNRQSSDFAWVFSNSSGTWG